MTDEQIGAAIQRAAATVSAPQALRERLAAGGTAHRRRTPPRSRVAFGGALAAVLAALVLLVTGGGPTVQQVAAAALRPPTAPAAGTWGDWSAVGRRSDKVGGRRAATVIYRHDGHGIHYSIVAGDPIDVPDGRTVRVGEHRYTVLHDGRTAIVTWRAGGHTCVLASREAGVSEMLAFLSDFYAPA